MSDCAHCRELLGGYVLGALEPDEEELARNHLADCRECRAERAQLAEVLPLLELADAEPPPVEAPPRMLEEAVLGQYARERRAARPPRRRALRLPARARWALAGVLAGATISLALVSALDQDEPQPQLTTVQLAGSPLAPGAGGTASLRAVAGGTEVRLTVEGLPSARGGLYELWLVRAEGRASAGTFRVGSDGAASTVMTVGVEADRYEQLGISHEPDALDPRRNGPSVLGGAITQ